MRFALSNLEYRTRLSARRREAPPTTLGGSYAAASYHERVLDDLADPDSVASRARLYTDASALAHVLGAGGGSLVRGAKGFRDAPVRLVRADYIVRLWRGGHRTVPPRPAELDGEVVVLVKAGGALDHADAAPTLQAALGAHGELVPSGTRYEPDKGRWRVRFARHAAAEAAVAALGSAEGAKVAGAAAVFLYYNGRPYEGRGYACPLSPPCSSLLLLSAGALCVCFARACRRWTCFESGVSTEALTRAQYWSPHLAGCEFAQSSW